MASEGDLRSQERLLITGHKISTCLLREIVDTNTNEERSPAKRTESAPTISLPNSSKPRRPKYVSECDQVMHFGRCQQYEGRNLAESSIKSHRSS